MSYALFDTTDPAAAQGDLYRDGETVYQDPQTGLWLVTGHQLVREVFRNTEDFSNDAVLAAICPAGDDLKPLMDALADSRSVVTLDPPDHGRIRTALDRVFPRTRDAVQKRWGGVVAGRVNEAVDALAGNGTVDLKPVCVRLSVRILCDVLGLSAAEHEDNLREWTDSFARLVWSNTDQDAKHADAANAAALFGLCQQIVEQRIAAERPGPGVIGALIGYRDQQNNPLSVDELVSQVLQLVGAGWETVASALCHLIELALKEPGAWRLMAAEPAYVRTRMHETLRLRPPIHGWQRRVRNKTVLRGRTIEPDQKILLLIAGANRDPEVFPDPGRFDQDRPNVAKHVAFGAGPHRCSGRQLAELVLTTAAGTFARRLPDLKLTHPDLVEFEASAVLLQPVSLMATTTGGPSGCPVAHGAGPLAARPDRNG